MASVLVFVLSTCELFKVARGGQTQTSHRQRVGNFSQACFAVVECKYLDLPFKGRLGNFREACNNNLDLKE